MGSLAGLLHARGLRVTGSDAKLYPPMSTALERWGIPVHEGFRAEHLLGDPPDLVVIGNAVRPDNPEARAAIDEGLPYLSFPDALYQLAMAGRHAVVVAGTHGKTTTTSLVASLLLRCGLDPSLLVGGFAHDFDGSFREGQGEHFVVEGDEYDTAFFDKSPKFLHYHPRTLILTSVEFDHADIYRDLDHVVEAFRSLVSAMPSDGVIVAATDHAGVRRVLESARCAVLGYGLRAGSGARFRAVDPQVGPGGTSFGIVLDGQRLAEATVPLFGEANLENALGAVACASELGAPLAEAARALAQFGGVRRRQEVRGEARGVTVIDDFAHHPTAVRASIAALRARFPARRLVAVFEPRTNTSRRALFQRDYARAFDGASWALVPEVPEEPLYSATGEVGELFSAATLAADLGRAGIDASAYPNVDSILEALVEGCRPGDVVLVMSNGSFGNIWEQLLSRLAADASPPR